MENKNTMEVDAEESPILAKALALELSNASEAIELYRKVILQGGVSSLPRSPAGLHAVSHADGSSPEFLKEKESAIYKLGSLYANLRCAVRFTPACCNGPLTGAPKMCEVD